MVPSITIPRMYQRKPRTFFISLFLHALPFGRLQHLRPSWCKLTDQYPIGMRQRNYAQRKEEYSSLIEKAELFRDRIVHNRQCHTADGVDQRQRKKKQRYPASFDAAYH